MISRHSMFCQRRALSEPDWRLQPSVTCKKDYRRNPPRMTAVMAVEFFHYALARHHMALWARLHATNYPRARRYPRRPMSFVSVAGRKVQDRVL